jgi:hypothetical protein
MTYQGPIRLTKAAHGASIVKLKVVRMSKQEILRGKAEELVRKIVTETFGQKTSSKIIATAAAKVARSVPDASVSKIYSTRAEISSNDQT